MRVHAAEGREVSQGHTHLDFVTKLGVRGWDFSNFISGEQIKRPADLSEVMCVTEWGTLNEIFCFERAAVMVSPGWWNHTGFPGTQAH